MRDWVEVPFEEPKPPSEANGRPPHAAAPDGPPRVFIALPTYNGYHKSHALIGLIQSTARAQIHFQLGFGSLLAMNFNSLWAHALNSRGEGRWTHFAMHHADISAPTLWLDVLTDEMDRVGADVLSVVVAIKDDRRTTSTGVVQDDNTIRRLTLKEVHRLPETFGEDDLRAAGICGRLVVNTGLWVCRFTEPWVEDVCFHVGDGVCRQTGGDFRVKTMPEDWNFSYWAGERGLKVMATRKVRTVHWGEAAFPSDLPADGWTTDLGDDPARYEEVRAARAAEGMVTA